MVKGVLGDYGSLRNFSWAVLIAISGVTGAVAADDAPRMTYKDAKAGAANVKGCVTDEAISSAGAPMITFRNDCDYQINLSLCVRSPEAPQRNHFFFILTGHSSARHRLWLQEDTDYQYQYNTCGKPNCMPPKAEC